MLYVLRANILPFKSSNRTRIGKALQLYSESGVKKHKQCSSQQTSACVQWQDYVIELC